MSSEKFHGEQCNAIQCFATSIVLALCCKDCKFLMSTKILDCALTLVDTLYLFHRQALLQCPRRRCSNTTRKNILQGSKLRYKHIKTACIANSKTSCNSIFIRFMYHRKVSIPLSTKIATKIIQDKFLSLQMCDHMDLLNSN